jgi:glyceraldehyde 3-phosphate dehydrogenase
MTIRIGINGFGRMGRLGLRAGWQASDYQIVHINEISGDALCMTHLLEFDSVHGRWKHEVQADPDGLIVDGRGISYFGDFCVFRG